MIALFISTVLLDLFYIFLTKQTNNTTKGVFIEMYHFKHSSFASKLKFNFCCSTMIPFIITTFLVSILFNIVSEKNSKSLVSNYITAIVRNIDVYFNELEQLTLSPYYHEDITYYLERLQNNTELAFLERYAIMDNIQNLLSFLRYSRTDIQSLVFVQENDCIYHTTKDINATTKLDYAYTDLDWYQESVSALGKSIYVPMHTPDYYIPDAEERVFSVSRAIINTYTRNVLAVIKIDANNEVLNNILNDTEFTVSSNVYLTDNTGNVIYAKDNAVTPNVLYTANEGESISTFEIGHEVQMVKLLSNGWSLHVVLDQTEMFYNTFIIFLGATIIYLLGAFISFYFYNKSTKQLVTDIDEIKDTLLAFENNDFAIRCNVNFSKEFIVLSESINHMILEFDKKIKQEYISKIRRQDAELKALHAQIEPHFLFNTLNSFIALSQDPTPEEQLLLEESLYSLCSLFRYVLDQNENVPIATELSILNDYCSLQSLRFEDRFSYEIIDHSNGDWIIPRLSIQPFVENAIIHGIEPSNQFCHLKIETTFIEESNTLFIQIIDDGIGTNQDIFNSKSIGVPNSVERFKIIYPQAIFETTSTPNHGCSILIKISNPLTNK